MSALVEKAMHERNTTTNTPLDVTAQKLLVAQRSVDTLVQEGVLHAHMSIGLGTGSTAMPAVKRIADHLARGTLSDIAAVPTSFQTALICERYNIPLFSLSSKRIGGKLDVTIDGADEIDTQNFVIKGGVAALLQEKIAAYNSAHFVIIVDETKVVETLGTRAALPIEVVPEARMSVMRTLQDWGLSVHIREAVRKKGPVVTDHGNFILDARWQSLPTRTPQDIERALNALPGVIENGLFTERTVRVFVAHADGSVEERSASF